MPRRGAIGCTDRRVPTSSSIGIETRMPGESLYVSDIVIYPIKSLSGIRVERAQATPAGLVAEGGLQDRVFMIVDEHGTFLTMRTHGDIFTKIHVSFENQDLGEDHNIGETRGGTRGCGSVVLRAPSITHEVLRIPLQYRKDGEEHQCPSTMDVRVWNWRGQAQVVGAHASSWISHVLGQMSHIVRCQGDDHHRPVDPEWVSDRTRDTAQVTFSDGFPYLFVFEESFTHLENELQEENISFTIDRFRGNIHVSGGTAWQEDSIQRLNIGEDPGLEFDLVKPCSRCKVPTIDPDNGSVDSVVHDVLVSTRSGGVLGWHEPKSFKHSTFFGVNGVYHDDTPRRGISPRGHSIRTPSSTFSVGDRVVITETSSA